jgi:membrane peptidoglycan carboxypeptidase
VAAQVAAQVAEQDESGATRTGYHRFIDYPRSGRPGWRALVPSWRLMAGSVGGGLALLAGLVAALYAMAPLPDVARLRMPTATVFEYSDGTVFYTAGLQDRIIVPIRQIPAMMQRAVVSVENPTFFTDAGISPRGIVRALANDLAGRPLQGGSTITQQFVKNAYLTDDQTFSRKVTEILMSVKITRAFPKQKILDDYLNTVYFGRGSYGVQAAAQTYFGVPASQITDPGRAAYLAALVNEPTVLSQDSPASQALLRQRWDLVLHDMVKAGVLTPARRAAVRFPRALAPRGAVAIDAHGVNDTAMAQVADGYLDELHARYPKVPDAAMADAGGDVIVTTFSRTAMTDAVAAVRAGLYDRLKPGQPAQAAADRGVEVGLATVDARNGELIGFYPGRSDFDNATQAQIEPGSQMAAFNLVAKFAASASAGDRSPLWALMGRVGLTRDLRSDPAELPEPLARLRRDPQLALGIAPESPARMADAFTVFPDAGIYHDLAMARSVTVNGHLVWRHVPRGTRALPRFSALAADQLLIARSGRTLLISGDNLLARPAAASSAENAAAFVSWVKLGARLAVVGEPGTIGGDGSAWFSGYDGDLATSVALWDQSPGPGGRAVRRSLRGLGGVPATRSVQWPTAIWISYLAKIATGPLGRSADRGMPGFAAPVTVRGPASVARPLG